MQTDLLENMEIPWKYGGGNRCFSSPGRKAMSHLAPGWKLMQIGYLLAIMTIVTQVGNFLHLFFFVS